MLRYESWKYYIKSAEESIRPIIQALPGSVTYSCPWRTTFRPKFDSEIEIISETNHLQLGYCF